MNDKPRPNTWVRNTHAWSIGDIVIHYDDAKRAKCLMRVVSIRENGDIVTEYANHDRHLKTYVNRREALLDPALFAIEVIE